MQTWPTKLLRRCHRDDRGALSVLILLTIFTLVGLIAMVWNTAEYSVRRRHVQAAVDAAAQSAAVWTSRTTNLVAASNQVIVENASAEVIWRATDGTVNAVGNRLVSERRQVEKALQAIDNRQQQIAQSKAPPDPNEVARLAARGNGLSAALSQMPPVEDLYAAFVERVTPGLQAITPSELAGKRSEIYDYQAQIVGLTSAAIEDERSALATQYKVEVAMAPPHGGSIEAPVKSVDHVNVEGVGVAGVSVNDGKTDVWVVGGNWGSIGCPPLYRFLHNRVSNDAGEGRSDSLPPMLRAIDNARAQIDQAIRSAVVPPPNANAAVIKIYSDTQADLLRMHLGQAFAHQTFANAVNGWTGAVLWGLGDQPEYVLSTYGRYEVPDWAKAGVYQDAYQYVYQDVYNRNYNRLYRMKLNQRMGEILQAQQQQKPPVRDVNKARAQAQGEATAWARQIDAQGSAQIATEAATEWIGRTWPYEIAPPLSEVPPTAGITTTERHDYFTLVAVAASTADTAPRPMLSKKFNFSTAPIVTVAQAETFDWMEYHGGYGAGDRYDRRTPPRPWRVSTAGGWSWQPRLAFSDAMGSALQNNSDLSDIFQESGLSTADPNAINTAILH